WRWSEVGATCATPSVPAPEQHHQDDVGANRTLDARQFAPGAFCRRGIQSPSRSGPRVAGDDEEQTADRERDPATIVLAATSVNSDPCTATSQSTATSKPPGPRPPVTSAGSPLCGDCRRRPALCGDLRPIRARDLRGMKKKPAVDSAKKMPICR